MASSQENPICLKCKKDLKVGRVGVPVIFNYGGSYAQWWDTRKCETCGYEILYGNGERDYNRDTVADIARSTQVVQIP